MAGDEQRSTDPDADSELTANISQTVSVLFSAVGVQDTLAQVVALAVSTIEGCDFAGIFLMEEGAVTTPVCTDQIVIELDALQHRFVEGPCLEALDHGRAFYADDLEHDHRWPSFGPEAVDRGVRSLLALPLQVNGTLGALNLYARYPHAFGVFDRGRAALLAAMAGLAFSSARSHEAEDRQRENLQAALATREVIGQAKGILMERERITPDQAFEILRRSSQYLNVKLRDVAQLLVDTGERPDTG